MITSWPQHGIWGDLNTPVPAATFVPLVGAWVSYVIDVSEGVEYLGEVTDGHLYWNARLPKGSSLVADVLVNDEGEWQRGMARGESIHRVQELNKVPDPVVRLKVKVVSMLSDIRPLNDVALRSIAIVLSRRGSMPWKSSEMVRLGWRGN